MRFQPIRPKNAPAFLRHISSTAIVRNAVLGRVKEPSDCRRGDTNATMRRRNDVSRVDPYATKKPEQFPGDHHTPQRRWTMANLSLIAQRLRDTAPASQLGQQFQPGVTWEVR